MLSPLPSEQYITIIDNKGREKTQFVEYVIVDARGETVYVTSDGLIYAQDSLALKFQDYLIAEFHKLPEILTEPEIVIWDPLDPPGETLIYYKRLYVTQLQERKLVAVIVKIRRGIKFFYNLHVQESGKVKGLAVVRPAEIEIWYLARRIKRSQFGL